MFWSCRVHFMVWKAFGFGLKSLAYASQTSLSLIVALTSWIPSGPCTYEWSLAVRVLKPSGFVLLTGCYPSRCIWRFDLSFLIQKMVSVMERMWVTNKKQTKSTSTHQEPPAQYPSLTAASPSRCLPSVRFGRHLLILTGTLDELSSWCFRRRSDPITQMNDRP